MTTPEQIAEQLWRDLNYEGRREYVCGIIAAALTAYGAECAAQERPEWGPIEPKPADWDTEYTVTLTGKNLEAMHYLSRFVLDKVRDPHPLPFGVIASADHLYCLAAAIRTLD